MLNGEKVTITKESVQENTKIISSTYSASSDSWEYLEFSNYTVSLSKVYPRMKQTVYAYYNTLRTLYAGDETFIIYS